MIDRELTARLADDLSRAFVWDETPEDYGYWDEVQMKLRSLSIAPRWLVRVTYHNGASKSFNMDELSELQSLIEGGRPFQDIKQITITYNFVGPS